MSLDGPGQAAMKEYFTSALVLQKPTLPQPLNYLLLRLGREETVNKCKAAKKDTKQRFTYPVDYLSHTNTFSTEFLTRTVKEHLMGDWPSLFMPYLSQTLRASK